MGEGKLAHELIVEMIGEVIKSIVEASNVFKAEGSFIHACIRIGRLGALKDALKRMNMREERAEMTINALRRIKMGSPSRLVEELLPEEFFLEIGHQISHVHISTEEARKVRKFGESNASQEERGSCISALYSRAGECPFCRRSILKAFSE